VREPDCARLDDRRLRPSWTGLRRWDRCLLSARRVGPTGEVFGVDMTDEMLDLARRTPRRQGPERRVPEGLHRGDPLPDASVDVVISNCVMTSRPTSEGDRRCSAPAGAPRHRDVISADGLTPEERVREAYVGCIAGALSMSSTATSCCVQASSHQHRPDARDGGRSSVRTSRRGSPEP
jgi:hypothetical protein